MDINEYKLVNTEKLDRAINGTVGSNGEMTGGVGADATPEAILAQYDKLGGLITLNGRKIKTGAFFDVKKNEAIAEPKPIYILQDLAGGFVEVPVDEDIPVEVRAAEKKAKEKKITKKVVSDEKESVE